MRIPEKVKIKFTNLESLEGFERSLETMITQYHSERPTLEEKIIGVSLCSMLKAVKKKLVDRPAKCTIGFPASDALCFLKAYKEVSRGLFGTYEYIKVQEFAHSIDRAC